jgi:CheY-like chemotaxis protein
MAGKGQAALTHRLGKLPIPRHCYCAPCKSLLNPIMFDPTSQILLVEEDPILLEVTAFRLELLGYGVVAKQTAESALEWLSDRTPALIIVDHVLSGMDGIEFINRLSNDTRTSEIPIMFLSTNSDLEDVQKAYNAGADEYLVIPYDPMVLESKVERLTTAVAQAETRKS